MAGGKQKRKGIKKLEKDIGKALQKAVDRTVKAVGGKRVGKVTRRLEKEIRKRTLAVVDVKRLADGISGGKHPKAGG
jgi:hypothetical protein